FQAEDGIRDFHVTGVQTCALPILSFWHQECYCQGGKRQFNRLVLVVPRRRLGSQGAVGDAGTAIGLVVAVQDFFPVARLRNAERSEERRVGKEWRPRW